MVVGGASPEGSIPLNRRLSVNRAKVLFNYLSRYGELPDSLKTNVFLGRDWNGLIRLVKDDENLPYREETMELLYELAEDAANNDLSKGDHCGVCNGCAAESLIGTCIGNIFRNCVLRGCICGMKRCGILAPVSMPPVKPTMPQTRAVEPMIVPYVPPQPRKLVYGCKDQYAV